MSVWVTVLDEQTSEIEESRVEDGDYVLITTEPCYLHHVASYANGTHVLTVKKRPVTASKGLEDNEI